MQRFFFTALLMMLASVLFTACKQKQLNWVQPVMAPITEAVFASGHLEAQDQFTLTAFSDGYIKQVLVKENDTVHKNQLLFIQDNTNPAIQQKAATENLAISRRNASDQSPALEQLYASLATANDQLAVNKTQLDRLTRLYATRSVAKTELDNAQLAYDNVVQMIRSIGQEIEATKLSLQKELVNSRSQYETAAASMQYLQLRSPGNYKVYQVLRNQGELLRKGDAVALLGDPTRLIAVLDIDENGIAKVKTGMKVLVQLNTEKNKTYPASISRLYPYFDDKTQSYKAEAIFDTTSSFIAGSLLQANVIVQQKENVMLIPRSCLSPDGKVIVQSTKGQDTLSIRTGIVSTEWVEVTGGLDPSQKVLKAF